MGLDEGWVIAVPADLIPKLIGTFHGDHVTGHGGVRKTTLAIRQRFHFSNMHTKVTKALRNVWLAVGPNLVLQNWTQRYRPWFRLTSFEQYPLTYILLDRSRPKVTVRYVLTIVYLFTKWTAFIPLKSKMPAEVLSALCSRSHWFHIHGLSTSILSDRGKEFLGAISTVCKVLDISHIKTTPYHPRTNGLCESQHKALT